MNSIGKFALMAGLTAAGVMVGCGTGAGGGGGTRQGQINLSACAPGANTFALAANAISLTNQARALAGVGSVTENAALTAAAVGHARSMAIEGFAAHQHPVTGERVSDRVLAQGYNYLAVGENLEFGGCTANWVVNEWLNSTAGHRENLLNATFTEIGMGVYQGGAEGMYWVQVLGTSQGGQADPGGQVSGDGCAPGADMAALAAAAVTFTNDARTAVGVGQVAENASLTAAALSHAQSMALEGFVGHEDPDTGERVDARVLAQGYSYSVVGENIATGFCAADTVVNEWLNSTGHRENLLNPDFAEIGVGVYQGGAEGIYWVQVFASPAGGFAECAPGADTAALAAEAIRLTNEAREAAGKGSVIQNAALTAAAEGHAQSMALEGFTGHEHPVTGARVGDRILAQGYNYAVAGENLEYGGCTADWVVNEWLNSTAGHREILLNTDYTEIGIGVYQGGEKGMYWVQVFATPW